MCSIGFISEDKAGQGKTITLFCARKFAVTMGSMGSGVVVSKSSARSKILHEWKEIIIQEVNVPLSIEITLYNHKICLDVAHDTSLYHNTPAPESIPFPDAALSISYISASIHKDPAVSLAYAEPRFITENHVMPLMMGPVQVTLSP